MKARTRTVTSTHPIHRFGADSQTDAKGIILGMHGADSDPFLFMAEDHFGPDKGFDWHPHRGLETVTLILDGELAHTDNTGGDGRLGPGEVQWMTAGRGIIHRELAATPVHTLQLWVNLPADRKFVEPSYQDLGLDTVAVRREPGAELRVFSGRSGDAVGPARNQHPIFYGDLRLDAGGAISHEVPADERFVAVVVAGGVTIADTDLVAGEVAIGDADPAGAVTTLTIESTSGGRVILFHGRPLDEPVVQYGPFVMNTEEQIREAIRDFQAGRFGPIPA